MIDVLLVGNPNTGKTTLFNSLTNSDEHTGNWHGVTVSEKGKTYIYKGNQINLVDLPGLYSLTTLSFEEEVARFQPSLDIDQAEESIYNNDMTDLSDVIDTIINGTSGKNDNQ